MLWRLTHPVAPESNLPPWQRVSSELVHWLLYLVVLLATLSGWFAASAKGWTIYLFGAVPLPRLVEQGSALGRSIGDWHELLTWVLLDEHPGKLDDYALASRLSYFLWSTMPDDELLGLAAAKKLGQPATLRAQVDRMLASPKAHAFVENFTGQWLDLRNHAAKLSNDRVLHRGRTTHALIEGFQLLVPLLQQGPCFRQLGLVIREGCQQCFVVRAVSGL